MEAKRYGHRREDDYPWAIAGFFLSLAVVIQNTLFLIPSFLPLTLVFGIIINRLYVRLFWIGCSPSAWSIKTPFKRAVIIPKQCLLRFSVGKFFFRTRLYIEYRSSLNQEIKIFHYPSFDLGAFLWELVGQQPEVLEPSALAFLERYKRQQKIRRSPGIATFFLIMSLAMLFLTLASKQSTIPEGMFFIVYPGIFSALSITALFLLARFIRLQWSNPSQAHSALGLCLFCFLILSPLLIFTFSQLAPSLFTINLWIATISLFLLAGVLFIRPSLLTLGVTALIIIGLSFFKSSFDRKREINLIRTFGESKGIQLDLGWHSGLKDFFWTIAQKPDGAIQASSYSLSGEKLAVIETTPERDMLVPSLQYTSGRILPISPYQWIAAVNRRIILRTAENEAVNLIWHGDQADSQKEELNDFLDPLLPSPSYRYIAWTTTTNRLCIASPESLRTKTFQFPHPPYTMLGWLSDEELIFQVSYFKLLADSSSQVHETWKLNVVEGKKELIDLSSVRWKLLEKTTSSFRLWGARNREKGVFHLFNPLKESKLETLKIGKSYHYRDLLKAGMFSDSTKILVLHSDSAGKDYIVYLQVRELFTPLENHLPGDLIDCRILDNCAIFIMKNGIVNEWWVLRKDPDTWALKRLGRTFALFNRFGSRKITSFTAFSPVGNRIIWQYNGLSGVAKNQGYAIWEFSNVR